MSIVEIRQWSYFQNNLPVFEKILLCVRLYTLRRVPTDQKRLSRKKDVILIIITHPPDPLPLTIIQWCVVLSCSVIGVVVIVIVATVIAAAAVAPSLPAALPNRWLLRRRRRHSPHPPRC